jgi:phenylalanyl-tRNA synthetase alpha chain
VMRQLYGPEREVRFRTHYFPFTGALDGADVSCFNCGGAGCPSASTPAGSSWAARGWSTRISMSSSAGARGVHGLRVRVGIERTAQLRYGISGSARSGTTTSAS